MSYITKSIYYELKDESGIRPNRVETEAQYPSTSVSLLTIQLLSCLISLEWLISHRGFQWTPSLPSASFTLWMRGVRLRISLMCGVVRACDPLRLTFLGMGPVTTRLAAHLTSGATAIIVA